MSVRTFYRQAAVVAVVACLWPSPAEAQSARVMYESALAREETVRSQLDRGRQVTRTEILTIVTSYERVVRRFPGSGYSDNALWQGSGLALTAFERFENPRDQRTAVRLLRDLRAGYPSSSLMPKVRDQLAQLEKTSAPPAVRNAGTTIAPSSAPVARVAASGTPAVERPRTTNPPPVPGSTTPAVIQTIQRIVMPDIVRVVVELDREVAYRDERLPAPSRMFLDLAGARPSSGLTDVVLRYDSDMVRQIRVGRHPNTVTRVVLDFDGIVSYSVYPLYNPYRLVIDCQRGGSLEPASRPMAEAPAATPIPAPRAVTVVETSPEELRGEPSPVPPAASAPVTGTAPLPDPSAVEHSSTPPAADRQPLPAAKAPSDTTLAPAAPSTNLRGGFSLARQLGLSISRIVIDPGHGGHDPGASARGVTESELVLDVALKLEQRLLKIPGVEVILTRRSNVYVPLEERTAIANREGADLFLSIHANASRNERARGVETYFLNFASSSEAAAVAARENSASGASMNSLPDIVRAIALNNKVDESRDFATYVQRSMTDRLRTHNKELRDLGVKQAPFVVLIGAAMPSVLAEVAFVTNRQEAQLLRSTAYRQRIADALLEGITRYQRALKRAPTVASGGIGGAKP